MYIPLPNQAVKLPHQPIAHTSRVFLFSSINEFTGFRPTWSFHRHNPLAHPGAVLPTGVQRHRAQQLVFWPPCAPKSTPFPAPKCLIATSSCLRQMSPPPRSLTVHASGFPRPSRACPAAPPAVPVGATWIKLMRFETRKKNECATNTRRPPGNSAVEQNTLSLEQQALARGTNEEESPHKRHRLENSARSTKVGQTSGVLLKQDDTG